MTADAPSASKGRLVVYAVEEARDRPDDHVITALELLRTHATRLVAIVPGPMEGLSALVDEVIDSGAVRFHPSHYAAAMGNAQMLAGFDEIVLTGDAWFGPLGTFEPVLERMRDAHADVWSLIENRQGAPEAFPDEGFPALVTPWTWTVARTRLFASEEWRSYWSETAKDEDPVEAETRFHAAFASSGFESVYAFPADDYPSDDPGLYNADLLLEAGCPVIQRRVFRLYPPFLDRFAIIGRELVAAMEARGLPMAPVWQSLARTVPAKALNTNAGMLEILPDVILDADSTLGAEPSVVALMHVSDVDGAPEVLDYLANIPVPYDLVITTADGAKAALLQRLVESRGDEHVLSLDVRVTPDDDGRDMSDLFVGCRDILLDNGHDLVVKVHSRLAMRKTVNARRYFRRYQLDNLLSSPEYVQNVFGLFAKEPGLGLVFPPMMHIGYGTMGRSWAGLENVVARLARELGIRVPLDNVSPLAPFGGMWIGRPDALRRFSAPRWRYTDYRRRKRPRELAHAQERLIVAAAAQDGFHARTVLTSEHASISHSALDFKVDQLFSTTRGWPVEQIRFLHRAGSTGYGGIVALSRMYLRLNHPRAARAMVPAYHVARRLHAASSLLRGRIRRPQIIRRDRGEVR